MKKLTNRRAFVVAGAYVVLCAPGLDSCIHTNIDTSANAAAPFRSAAMHRVLRAANVRTMPLARRFKAAWFAGDKPNHYPLSI